MHLTNIKTITATAATMLCLLVFPAKGQTIPDIVWATNIQAGSITAVAFSGDSSLLAFGSDASFAQVRDVANAQLIRAFGSPNGVVLSVALSPDGNYVGVGDGAGVVHMWRVSDGQLLWKNSPSENLIRTLAFSPDTQYFADGRSDTDIFVHDPVTGLATQLSGHEADVVAIAFSPNSTLLASASVDQTARIWRVADRTTLHILANHSNTVTSVDFSPDGTLLATASSDGTARLWRVSDAAELRIIEGGGGNAAKFSADGKLLLTEHAGPIKIWRVIDGTLLHTYSNAQAGSLAVASNGKYFAYGRYDGAVILARMPLWIEETTRNGNEITLRWQGGSGRYQLQGRNSLTAGQWQNIGNPTTNTFATHSCVTPLFYRVQSLPNL